VERSSAVFVTSRDARYMSCMVVIGIRMLAIPQHGSDGPRRRW
jgi:hypothetical protein